jgi:hypothetical protein
VSEWQRDDSGLSITEIEKRQPYKFEAHTFKTRRRMTWPVCQRCGLVLLRNELTDWAVKHGCNNTDHPDYRAAVARLSKPRRPS